MYRKTALDKLPPRLFEICSYDWIINICIARSSLIGFLKEPMSVYRVHSNGAWSKMSQIEKLKQQLALIPEYNNLTNNVFHEEFEALLNKLQFRIAKEKYVNLAFPRKSDKSGKIFRLTYYLLTALYSVACLIIPTKLKRLIVKKFIGVA
jgi:hypothetical protein